MVLQYFKKKENKEINIANIEYKKILNKSNNFLKKNIFSIIKVIELHLR